MFVLCGYGSVVYEVKSPFLNTRGCVTSLLSTIAIVCVIPALPSADLYPPGKITPDVLTSVTAVSPRVTWLLAVGADFAPRHVTLEYSYCGVNVCPVPVPAAVMFAIVRVVPLGPSASLSPMVSASMILAW